MSAREFHSSTRLVTDSSSHSAKRVVAPIALNRILSCLNEATLARLKPYLELVSHNTGDEILKAGEQIGFLYFPETLVISQLCYLRDGSSAAASLVGREGVIGSSALTRQIPAQYWWIASVGGTVRRIGVEKFRAEFRSNASLQNLMLMSLNDRLHQLAQGAVCSIRHHLEERLCTWLLMILDRTDSSILPLTHEAISDHLGVRRAGVTSCCNNLRDRGVISTKRGKLNVIDRQALKSFACECYESVGLHSEN